MKDPLNTLRTAYFEHLKGKVTLKGEVVEVFADNVPKGIKRPYIFIGSQTHTERQTGLCKSYDTTMLVQVVTQYHPQAVQGSEVLTISAQVNYLMSQVKTWSGHLNNEFQVSSHLLDTSNGLSEDDGENFVNRRLLRFRDIVFEH